MAHTRARDWPQLAYKYRVYLEPRSLRAFPDAVQNEAALMRDLWNELVDVWEENSEQYNTLLTQVEAVHDLTAARAAALTAYQETVTAWKQARSRHRTKSGPVLAPFVEAKRVALATLHTCTADLKAQRELAREQLRPELHALQERLWERIGNCLQASPVHWSNKELVQQGFEACLKRFFRRTGDAPKKKLGPLTRFTFRHRFSGGGLPLQRVFRGGPNRLWIDTLPPPEAFAPHRPDSVKKQLARVTGGITIANEVLPFRIMLHRELPPGAMLKSATLSGERCQRQYYHHNYYQANWRYHLVFGLEIPHDSYYRIRPAGPPQTASIDLGWRKWEDNERIRFGFLRDSTGEQQELFLPAHILNDWRYCQEMQEQASRSIDQVKADLQATLWYQDREWEALPEDQHPLFLHLAQLRGPGKLWRLLALEREGHIPGTLLQTWARHWSNWDRQRQGVHGRLVRARNHTFRVLTNQLCQQYAEINIEKLALDRLATQESDAQAITASQQYRQLTGLSYFIGFLKQSAQRWQTVLTERNPANTTRTCHICGAMTENAADLYLECPNGHRWDQDANAAHNLSVATA